MFLVHARSRHWCKKTRLGVGTDSAKRGVCTDLGGGSTSKITKKNFVQWKYCLINITKTSFKCHILLLHFWNQFCSTIARNYFNYAIASIKNFFFDDFEFNEFRVAVTFFNAPNWLDPFIMFIPLNSASKMLFSAYLFNYFTSPTFVRFIFSFDISVI